MATMRAASGKAVGHRALANSNVSSLRVKPFTALAKPANRAVLAKATAVDAEEDLDFSFSFSDAKKNNEYSAADVEAAIRFYQDGEGSGSVFDADFVTNTFGSEDASFFDDIDNEEAYGDEYIVAGIPEAAPKRRGRGRGKDDGQADDDDLEQAKALDKVKALEDRMVLEAAMEEEFGNASRSAADFSDSKTGVWDWLADLESKDAADAEQLGATRQANSGSLAFLSDSQVTNDIARAKPELFENTEVPTFLELFSNDDVTEDVLAALEDNTDAEGVASTLDDADLARLDALLAQEVPVLDLAPVGDANVPAIDDSPELNRQLVDQYIEQLRRVQKSSGASAAEIKALFGDEPLTLEPAAVAESKEAQEETQKLLAAAEPQLTAVNIDFDAQAAAIQDNTGEPDEEDETGLERELQALSAIDIFTEEDYPTDAVLEGLEGYLVSAEDYIAQEEARNASIAAAVARGELSPDALAEELEEVADAEDEVVRDLTMAGDDEDGAGVSVFEDNDGETWVERIIELTRVTKVVKGGKIMGFRCVAIVGNENGLVGVGCQAGREVAVAVKRTLVDAKRNLVKVPLVGAGTVPHRSEAKYHAARCVVVPASDGTGCIAGGSVRSVLELAGVKNCLAKRLGSRSALNSARATVKALQQMQTLNEVSRARGVPMDKLLLQ